MSSAMMPEPLFQRAEGYGHWMFTLGWPWLALRITKGRLDRRGKFHEWQPCIFLLFRDRAVYWGAR